MTATHTQTWAKVNAPVDVGVKPLVEALSAFPALRTVESCEGAGARGPWVCFQYGDEWRELSEFVFGNLAPGLLDTVGDSVSVALRAADFGEVYADLWVRPNCTDEVVRAIQSIAKAA